MLVSEDAHLFGVRIDRFRLVDYYTIPWEEVRAGTPPAVMIATHALATGKEDAFAWHLVAEEQNIPPEEIPARQADLERLILQAFAGQLREGSRTWWLHWGLCSIDFGFPAQAQRARALGLGELPFPVRRMIDLATLLKRRLGDGYMPHNRLRSLIRLNGINDHGLLGVPELTAAFRAGDHCRMLRSLRRKLACLARIVELGACGKLQTGSAQLAFPADGLEPGRAGWITCARGVLSDARPPAYFLGDGTSSGLMLFSPAESASGGPPADGVNEGRPERRVVSRRERVKRDRRTEARDKWLYRQCRGGKKTYRAIVLALNRIADRRRWRKLASPQAVEQAVDRYVRRNKLPPLPPRKEC